MPHACARSLHQRHYSSVVFHAYCLYLISFHNAHDAFVHLKNGSPMLRAVWKGNPNAPSSLGGEMSAAIPFSVELSGSWRPASQVHDFDGDVCTPHFYLGVVDAYMVH